MIRHTSLWLERQTGPLNPQELEDTLRAKLGEPLRWAITAVEEGRMRLEVSHVSRQS